MARILIVDDSPVEIKIICHFLGDQYDYEKAHGGPEALEMAAALPDLILLDIIMPDMDGFEVCRRLKADARTAAIPILFITAITNSQSIIDGFEAGGQDYITKPFCARELKARIKAQLDLRQSQAALEAYAEELERKNSMLQSLLKQLEQQNRTDFLTGLATRRHVTDCIKRQAEQCKEENAQAIILIGDIDDFKRINDTYGHDCGDRVLKTIAQKMRSLMRGEDIAARWGGDEFLFLLHNMNLDQGRKMADRIRSAIERTVFQERGDSFSVTLTFGVGELNSIADFDAALKLADEGMYGGKGTAKNCVVAIKSDEAENLRPEPPDEDVLYDDKEPDR